MKKSVFFAMFLSLIIVCFYFGRYFDTHKNAIIIPDVIYEAGEMVPFDNNFYWTSSENPAGYYIRIDSARLLDVEQYLYEHNALEDGYSLTDESGYQKAKYMYEVEVTISNDSNTDGMVQFSNWIMIDKSIILRLDTELLELGEPTLENAGAFTLKPGVERTFKFPFIADPGVASADPNRLTERMTEGDFFLCISQVPERRLIAIQKES